MEFSVSGVTVAPWIPPLVAFCISFFTSMGGVSGAFLLLPFQVSFLGFTSPAVSATNHLYNTLAIPGGVVRYFREGRLVWPLALVVVVGTIPGVLVGTLLRVRFLPDPRAFKLFAGLVLLYIGARMLRDLLARALGKGETNHTETRFNDLVRQHGESTNGSLPRVSVDRFSIAQVVYRFYGERFEFSTPGVLGLSLLVGIIGGVYGIGGGAIMAPFLVSVFGLPVYTVAGAALLGTFVTSVVGVIFYQAIAPLYPEMAISPDWMLGLLFGLGGLAGIYCGARLQKYVPARLIKWMLASVILFTAGKYVLGYLR